MQALGKKGRQYIWIALVCKLTERKNYKYWNWNLADN